MSIAIGIGENLDGVHHLLAGVGRDGAFTPWVKERCGFTPRTAYNYIGAYRVFGKCETISHFSAGAIYLLARESTPVAAVEKAVDMTTRGEHITLAVAKQIAGESKSAKRAVSSQGKAAAKTEKADIVTLANEANKLVNQMKALVRKSPMGVPAQRENCLKQLATASHWIKEARWFGEKPQKPCASRSKNVTGSKTPACPNCGHREFDDDGDCEKCREPDVYKLEGAAT